MTEASMTGPAPDRRSLQGTFRTPLTFVHNGKRRLAAIAASSFIAGLMEAAALILLTQVAVGSAADLSSLPLGLEISTRSALAICAVMLIGKLLFSVLGMRVGTGMASEALVNSRRTLLEAFLQSSWSAQSTDRLGDLQQTLTVNVDRVAFMIVSGAAILSSGLTVLVMLGSSLVISPVAALVTIAAGSLLFFGLRPLGERAKQSATLHAMAGRRYATQVTETARLAREVKVHAVEQPVADKVAASSAESATTWKRTRILGGLLPQLYQSIALLLVVAGLAVASELGPEQLASVGATVLLLVRSVSYGQQLQAAVQQQRELSPYLIEIDEELQRYESARDNVGAAALDRVDSMQFADVSFSYTTDQPALRGINFDVRRGEAIGIVGPSGAGKTTLMQLILRLRRPNAGTIQVNDQLYESFRHDDWFRHVALVPQDARLVAGTVADNIRFYREVSDGAVIRAAKLAHLHDDIASWPHGYETEVGEDGGFLSGGQRQRLAIARALASEPDLIVFDEPTSALDGISERLITETFAALHGDVTLIIIAHRLSTIAACDRVMVIENGAITAFRPPAELHGLSKFFDRSIAHQAMPSFIPPATDQPRSGASHVQDKQ